MKHPDGRASARTFAPAKINLTLEVLGKREDGYHEIRSVMQTILMGDVLFYEPADTLSLEVENSGPAPEDDLVLVAARAFAEARGVPATGRFRVVKTIPSAAGLGGGSSDAAAALRLLNHAHGNAATREELAKIAATFSSDAPFFCYGGTALVSGRGERVEPLPDIPECWFVVFTPLISIDGKTRRMYEALRAEDHTDGGHSSELVQQLRRSVPCGDWQLFNAFGRAAYEVAGRLRKDRDALRKAGLTNVQVAGSGPSLYGIVESRDVAIDISMRAEVKPPASVGEAQSWPSALATIVYE